MSVEVRTVAGHRHYKVRSRGVEFMNGNFAENVSWAQALFFLVFFFRFFFYKRRHCHYSHNLGSHDYVIGLR